MTALAFWTPSQHAVVLTGVVIAAVLLASVLVAWRDDWVPLVSRHHRELRWAVVGGLIAIGLGLAVAHREELEEVLHRVEQAQPGWLALALGLEVISFAGYVVLTEVVYRPRAPRLSWRAAAELTLAGVVATRVFSAGGAGGIAFTGWVLSRAGMTARTAARRLTAFLVLLYSVYIAALVIGGALAVAGVLGDVPRPLGVAALLLGGVVTVLIVLIMRIPGDLERRVKHLADRGGLVGRTAARLATVPQVAGTATRLALSIARERPSVLLWPLVWWGFDVATLWACLEGFGTAPAAGTIVLCYFVGQLGNLLPLPGGVGGTEGGMGGALVACGTPADLAFAAVVAYQLISTYLPGLPGLLAYASLRRRMKSWAPSAEPEPGVAAPGTAKA